VEEIVGDIQDEYDHEETLHEQINDHEYVFDAKVSLYDFNEIMISTLMIAIMRRWVVLSMLDWTRFPLPEIRLVLTI